MSYPGIDYGLGRTNRDTETGIRYGVISQYTVGQAWYDDAQPDYGEATCPKCGNAAKEYGDSHEDYDSYSEYGCADYACENCEHTLDSCEVFSEEPLGHSFENAEYTLTNCLDSDIMVIKSPYYTFAQFCSPCVPGAGNLDSPMPEGAKTYCLGHNWFESGVAPYPVYCVKTDALIAPKSE